MGRQLTLQTQYPFTLPKGYVDDNGTLHRHGVMRLATARDEIEPLRDPRVAQNEAYLTVLVLSRVIIELGTLDAITETVVEGLFAADLAYLQEIYGIINFGDPSVLEADRAFEDPAAVEDPGAVDTEDAGWVRKTSVEEVMQAQEA